MKRPRDRCKNKMMSKLYCHRCDSNVRSKLLCGMAQAPTTPLYSASEKGHVEVVARLIAAGCDVNQPIKVT